MVILVFALAAAACLATGVLSGMIALTYLALGLSVCTLLALGWSIWRDRNSTRKARADFETENPVSQNTETNKRIHPDDQPEKSETETQDSGTESDIYEASEAKTQEVTLCLTPSSIVHVIPGRKRFHLKDCRFVKEHSTEELTLTEAHEESFTPCSICIGTDAEDG